jgi:methionine-rich copper-binding protein CopC
MNNKYNVLTAILVLLWACSSSAYAQHSSHTYRYTGDVQVEHMPDHDEVLPTAPDNLLLRFTDHVRLLKLVVKTADEKVVNINFRYDPTPDRVFIWSLPELPASDWYTVDWGAVDRVNKMMSGQFVFAAGADAKQPSTIRVVEEIEHIVVPDYRLINPESFRPVSPAR